MNAAGLQLAPYFLGSRADRVLAQGLCPTLLSLSRAGPVHVIPWRILCPALFPPPEVPRPEGPFPRNPLSPSVGFRVPVFSSGLAGGVEIPGPLLLLLPDLGRYPLIGHATGKHSQHGFPICDAEGTPHGPRQLTRPPLFPHKVILRLQKDVPDDGTAENPLDPCLKGPHRLPSPVRGSPSRLNRQRTPLPFVFIPGMDRNSLESSLSPAAWNRPGYTSVRRDVQTPACRIGKKPPPGS